MDRTGSKPMATSGAFRTMLRRPGLVALTAAVAGSAFGIRYMASRMKNNELAQKNSDSPNLYVSVDRSGGGI